MEKTRNLEKKCDYRALEVNRRAQGISKQIQTSESVMRVSKQLLT